MSDTETEQIVKNKYRYYAGLVWNDFYTLLSVLDESIDKTDLDRCWKDFYFSFWKGSAERHSFIDQLITAYLEKMPIEDRDILEMDLPFQTEVHQEEEEEPSIFQAVRAKMRSCLISVIEDRIEIHLQKITSEITEELSEMESVVIPFENGSDFSNLWEEFAFHVRKGKDHLYHPCEKTVLQLCREHLERLSLKELGILWLGTSHGREWRDEGHFPDPDWMLDILERVILARLEENIDPKDPK